MLDCRPAAAFDDFPENGEKRLRTSREKGMESKLEFELTLIPTPFNPNKYVKRHFHSCPLFRLRISRFFFLLPHRNIESYLECVSSELTTLCCIYMFGLVFSLAFFSSSHCHNNISNGKGGKKKRRKTIFQRSFLFYFIENIIIEISTFPRGSSKRVKVLYFLLFCWFLRHEEERWKAAADVKRTLRAINK